MALGQETAGEVMKFLNDYEIEDKILGNMSERVRTRCPSLVPVHSRCLLCDLRACLP